jgi:hypothetical protein
MLSGDLALATAAAFAESSLRMRVIPADPGPEPGESREPCIPALRAEIFGRERGSRLALPRRKAGVAWPG